MEKVKLNSLPVNTLFVSDGEIFKIFRVGDIFTDATPVASKKNGLWIGDSVSFDTESFMSTHLVQPLPV